MRIAESLGVLPLAVLLVACPGTLEDPERFEGTLEEIVIETAPIEGCGSVEQDILLKRCTTSGCHSGHGLSASVDLKTPGIFERLANRPATQGGMLIVPGDPNASVLYRKLQDPPPFGGRMPVGAALDAPSVDCVRRWIEVNR